MSPRGTCCWPVVATTSPEVSGFIPKLRFSAWAEPCRRRFFWAGAKTTRVAGFESARRISTYGNFNDHGVWNPAKEYSEIAYTSRIDGPNFEVVIVDSPPLGAGVDAYALGAVTGNVLLVLRLGTTNREIAEAKLDLLDRLPVRLLGTVLNDVPERSAYYPYSYYLEGYAYEAERGREPRSIAPQPVHRGGRARR